MASKWPPVKNSAFSFRCVLFAQSDNQIKSNPTIEAGDWKVSTDGGAFANLATLPDVDPDSSVQVLVSLSAGEMNGDEIVVTAIDASGDEWHSFAVTIHTVGQTFDAVDANIDSILADTGTDGVKIAADAITASTFDESTAYPLKSADTGATQVARVGADGDTLETLSDQLDATATAAALATVDGIVDDILTDTGTTLPGTLATLATAADLATVDGNVDAILEDTGTTLPATLANVALEATTQSILTDTGTTLPAAIADIPTNAELATALASADDAVLAAIAALNNLSSAGAQAAAAAALLAYGASTLTAAQVNAEVDTALADYDPPTKAELDSAVAPLALEATVGALNDISAADVVTAIEAATVDGTITRLQMERILLAFIGGLTTGGGSTSLEFLAQDDTTARIAATVDGDGNRTAVTLDGD